MDLTLGLVMSARAVRFLLTEGSDGCGQTLECDEFEISRAGGVSAPSISEHVVSVVLGTQAIASARGHTPLRVGITWTEELDTEAALVLESLSCLGIPNVVPVPMLDAAEAFACMLAETHGSRKTAVFIAESESAVATTVSSDGGDRQRGEAGRSGSTLSSDGGSISHITSQVYRGRFVPDEALRSLAASMFSHLTDKPDALFVAGAGWDFDGIAEQLDEVSQLRVVAPAEAAFALARGAAIASTRPTLAIVSPTGEADDEATPTDIAQPTAGDGFALPWLFVPRTARLARLDGPPKTEPTPALPKAVRHHRSAVSSAHVLTAVLIGAFATFLVSTTLAFTDRTAVSLSAPAASGAEVRPLPVAASAPLPAAGQGQTAAPVGQPAQPLFIPGLSNFSLVAPAAPAAPLPPPAAVSSAGAPGAPVGPKLPGAPDVLAMLSNLLGGASVRTPVPPNVIASTGSDAALAALYEPMTQVMAAPTTVDGVPDVTLPVPLNPSGAQ
ncbi:MAG: hypothetical protein K2Q25_15315 [Mycobacteriaceae bacterium]|nr:hypothetical protein [Mycobacteriaceae bacterium]